MLKPEQNVDLCVCVKRGISLWPPGQRCYNKSLIHSQRLDVPSHHELPTVSTVTALFLIPKNAQLERLRVMRCAIKFREMSAAGNGARNPELQPSIINRGKDVRVKKAWSSSVFLLCYAIVLFAPTLPSSQSYAIFPNEVPTQNAHADAPEVCETIRSPEA